MADVDGTRKRVPIVPRDPLSARSRLAGVLVCVALVGSCAGAADLPSAPAPTVESERRFELNFRQNRRLRRSSNSVV
jgi:hypothetical protein